MNPVKREAMGKEFIRVKFNSVTRKWQGDRLADGWLLSYIIGRRYFSDEDYDKTLDKVSEYGFGFERDLEEV